MAPFSLPLSAGRLPIIRPARRFLSHGLPRVPISLFQHSLPWLRCSPPIYRMQSIRNMSHHRKATKTQPSTTSTTNTTTAGKSSSPSQSTAAFSLRRGITKLINQFDAILDRLGATRTVKIVVVVCLSIWGTCLRRFFTSWPRCGGYLPRMVRQRNSRLVPPRTSCTLRCPYNEIEHEYLRGFKNYSKGY